MINKRSIKLLLASILTIVIAFTIFTSSISFGEEDSFTKTKEKLAGISEDERGVLHNLFLLVQDIEEMEREENKISKEIYLVKEEIKIMEVMIVGEETAYEKKRDVLKQVLNSYQRKGAGSFLEIILDSNNLTDFLRRVNTLRDLTGDTGELLEQLKESKEKLSIEKGKLAEKLTMIEDKQKQLRIALDSKLQLRDDIEKYLSSLDEQRGYYEEHLANIQKLWGELKPLIAEITKGFFNVIENENLPPNAIKTTFSILGVKGVIDEKTFNDIVAEDSLLSQIEFSFEPNNMTMNMANQNLILSGNFTVLEGIILKFQVEKGSFYSIPLELASIEELFQEGYLILNLKPYLGKSTLKSVKIEEGFMELTIIPSFFN